jgi:hypothetical protein
MVNHYQADVTAPYPGQPADRDHLGWGSRGPARWQAIGIGRSTKAAHNGQALIMPLAVVLWENDAASR